MRRQELNTRRFLREDLRPNFLKALANTKVLSAVFSLLEQKSAPEKLQAHKTQKNLMNFCDFECSYTFV